MTMIVAKTFKKNITVWNVSQCGVFSGRYFHAFGLNTERYEVSLRIQSECGKIQTWKNSIFEHFSRNVFPYKKNNNVQQVW